MARQVQCMYVGGYFVVCIALILGDITILMLVVVQEESSSAI